MADSSIDWAEVRRAALDCVEATWRMVCFAGWSWGDEYDEARATAHLAAIDEAFDVFRRAEIFAPGFPFTKDDSSRHSPVFDAIALASAGVVSRPDFQYGAACCSTAHEAAFELLRRVILWVELGLDDLHVGIDDLHELSPDALKITLSELEKRKALRRLLSDQQLHELRAWIDREWAAVLQTLPGGGGKGIIIPLTPEAITILEALAGEAGMTVTQEDLAYATKSTTPTVRKYLNYLREHDLVHQPLGGRKGYTLTDAGRDLLVRRRDLLARR